MEAARYAIPASAGEGLLVVGISASGETARTLEAVQLAKELGARTIGITTNPNSSLGTTVEDAFITDHPQPPEGPGLLSYLGALLAGYALGAKMSNDRLIAQIDKTLRGMPVVIRAWMEAELVKGNELARQIDPVLPMMFLGSGPIRGAAMFSAAKVIELVGQPASSQDVEEWAHLEYFNQPAELPIWLLSAVGRASEREQEVAEAARQIGRTLMNSTWEFGPDSLREELGPLALWVGPVAYASSLMDRIGERPFRDFGGGRSRDEGGGASRIRTSSQVRSLKEFNRFNPLN
jgi:glucosamine--fructose-6-phosphate aminotransferase (isomerizing)